MGVVDIFFTNPRNEHKVTMKWIFRYLKRSSKVFSSFWEGAPILTKYTNAYMARDVST